MGSASSSSNNNNNQVINRRKSSGRRIIRVRSARSCGPPHIVEYTEEQARLLAILKKRKYNYDSLVFGGGGAKGVAYYGALQVLNDLGILPKVRRFAGTSAGAIMANFLSLGLSPKEVYELHKQMKTDWFLDAPGGKCCLLPNLINKLGWNPSKKTTKALSAVVRARLGKGDITFMEMYQTFGVELCIVASDLTTMTVEYFHPKTTPDMSVVTAVRASMSIPFLMQPVLYENHLYVDGGLICNYPIHVFDGWFLSMEDNHSFHNQLNNKQEQFEGHNQRTLGLDLDVGDDTAEKVKEQVGSHGVPQYPATKLARSREDKARERRDAKDLTRMLRQLGQHFAELVKDSNKSSSQRINIDELQASFSKNNRESDVSNGLPHRGSSRVQTLFDGIRREFASNQNEISFDELLNYMRKKGASLSYPDNDRGLQKVESVIDFGTAMLKTMSKISMFHVPNEKNSERTITVSAGYVETTDFEMEEEDRVYLVHQGIWACLDFLMSKYKEDVTKL